MDRKSLCASLEDSSNCGRVASKRQAEMWERMSEMIERRVRLTLTVIIAHLSIPFELCEHVGEAVKVVNGEER